MFLFSHAQSNLPLDCSFCLQQQGIQPPLSLNMQGQLSFAESTFNTVAHKSGIKDAILYGGWKKLIWTQNDYLQRCFLLHEIDLHASVILLLLSSPFFFFFFLNSKQESANSTDEGGNTSQRSLASNPQIVHGTLNMHVDYGAVKRWVWITRDTVIMRWDIEPLFCYRSIFRAHANEKGTKIKSPLSAKKKGKKGGTLTFLHFRWPCGYFHLQFKWIRQYNDFKSPLCQSECYREERRRNRGEK